MPVGQGSISVNQRKVSSTPGPPFPSNSADNGLSVDTVTGRIILGQNLLAPGNPGQLTANKEIPLNGNSLYIGGLLGNPFILLDDPNNRIQLFLNDFRVYGPGSNFFIDINSGANTYLFGDISGKNNNNALSIDDGANQITFSQNAVNHFLLDDTAKNYSIGDITGAGNGNQLLIDDLTANIYLGDPNFIEPVINIQAKPSGGVPYIELYAPDSAGTNYVDISIRNNPAGTFIVDVSNTKRYQQIINSGGVGSDDYVIRTFQGAIVKKKQYIDFTNNLYQYGDIDTQNNGTFFTINDVIQQLLLNAVNGLKITGDTVMIHSGTAYADGSAANAGTLNNAPAAGDPTKWIPIDDNGTTRYIPAW